MQGLILSDRELNDFQSALLEWFEENGRDFPWRKSIDPYAILVAEKLLQQTRVRQAVVYAYSAIIARYPSITALANADQSYLESLVKPLGLTYRAGELIQTAQDIVNRHESQVPKTLSELLSITGIGQYTARAILCFAFGQHIGVVDTNVARFLFRLYCIQAPMPANPARKRSLIDMVQTMLPDKQSRNFNLAVIDLCATVCISRGPLCDQCPVKQYCLVGTGACMPR